jgi:hypothetical protein
MNENNEHNNKVAGRIENLSRHPKTENPTLINTDKLKNVIQFTQVRSHKWSGSIRQLINKSIELFEAGPKQP